MIVENRRGVYVCLYSIRNVMHPLHRHHSPGIVYIYGGGDSKHNGSGAVPDGCILYCSKKANELLFVPLFSFSSFVPEISVIRDAGGMAGSMPDLRPHPPLLK